MTSSFTDDTTVSWWLKKESASFNFKLMGQITVEEAQHGPWKVGLERPLSAGTDADMHHLHLSSLEVYDQTGAKLSLTYNGNASECVKRGHGDPAATPANVIDGNFLSSSNDDYSGGNTEYGTQDHWMEFDIAEATVYGSGTPTTAVIANRKDIYSKRLAGVRLLLASVDSEGRRSSWTAVTLTGETNQTLEFA